LERRRIEYLTLGSTWRIHLTQPQVNLNIPTTWGPTDEEFNLQSPVAGNMAVFSESEDEPSDTSMDGLADDLLQVLESFPLLSDNVLDVGEEGESQFHSELQGSPKKRARRLSDA
jgi:hypothetical protein